MRRANNLILRVKLPADLLSWLQSQDESPSKVIRRALFEYALRTRVGAMVSPASSTKHLEGFE